MDKMMGTLFRLLCRHLRTIWLRARGLFFSIRLRILRTNPSPSPEPSPSPSPSTAQAPMPTSSSASRILPPITNLSTAKTKGCQWACTHARDLKAQVAERRVARKNMMNQLVYARMAARAVGQVTKKEEGDGVAATGKYCANAIEDDDEDDEEAVEDEDEEEGNGLGTDAQDDGDDLSAFDSLFEPLSSSPTLRFVASRRSRSPFPPSLSLLSPVSTPGLLTPELLAREPRVEVETGSPSPTTSFASSGFRFGSVPTTPTTSQGLAIPFPRTADDAEAAPVTRLHLRPNPRPRIRFRTLSASITARSPLSLSFPLSLSLPQSTRRVFSAGAEMNRYVEQGNQGEDRAKQLGRTGRDVADAATAGEDEDRGRIGDGEDPFGTHGRTYYAPHARVALGFGDAYDLSAWAWACDHPSYSRQKRKHGEKRHVRPGSATIPAFSVAGADIGILAGGTGPGSKSGSVYSTPIFAASAPQLSCANCPDREVEYLRAMAKAARARARDEMPPLSVRQGPSTRDRPGEHQQHAPGYRGGIRPLLLPQKLGLPGSGVPIPPRKTDKANDMLLSGGFSGGFGSRATGWERDLERGVSGEGDGAEA